MIICDLLQSKYGVSVSQKRVVEMMCTLTNKFVSILQEKPFSESSDKEEWVGVRCYDVNGVCEVIRCRLASESVEADKDNVQEPF